MLKKMRVPYPFTTAKSTEDSPNVTENSGATADELNDREVIERCTVGKGNGAIHQLRYKHCCNVALYNVKNNNHQTCLESQHSYNIRTAGISASVFPNINASF